MTRLVSVEVERSADASYLVEVPGPELDADVLAAAWEEDWEEVVGEIIVRLGQPPKSPGAPDFVLRDGRLVEWEAPPSPPTRWYEAAGWRWATDGSLLIREDALAIPAKTTPPWIDRDVDMEGLLLREGAVPREEATGRAPDGKRLCLSSPSGWRADVNPLLLAPFGAVAPTLWIAADPNSAVRLCCGTETVGYLMPLRSRP